MGGGRGELQIQLGFDEANLILLGQRLDRAVKRAESTLEREKREAVERDAIHKAKKDERLKRAQGKKAWYLKKGAYCFLAIHNNV